MKLLDSDIKKFQALYLKHFGEKLDANAARVELTTLVRQMQIVYQPITYGQFDAYLDKYVNEEDKNDLPKKDR